MLCSESELNLSDESDGIIELKNKEPEVIAVDPLTKNDILLKKGRFGPYVQCGDKMKSLPPKVSMEDVDETLAINLASLPKNIGSWGEKNDDILLDIGKFGPYIRAGKETRSIPADIAMFDLTYDGAIKLLSEEKSNSRQPKTIKDLGDGIEVKEGRYGMYITNGKVNVKMPKDATPDTLILDDAKKLISEKKPKPKRKFKRK